MKCMTRNKVEFYYALYEGKQPVTETDEWGNTVQTGEWEVVYGIPQQGYANISAAKGETQTRQFGEDESYDKVIVFEKGEFPIDEYSVLWVDTLPKFGQDTVHDYVITKRAISLNSVSLALRKVNVS